MEAALYDPAGGYYAGARPDADYYTSPAAHPAFGALIAVQLSRMWEALGRPGRFTAVEMGSGSGLLASDVVSYARRALGAFADALDYVTVDRARSGRAADGVRHVVASRMPLDGVVGCVLSNELLDAFPVRRFEVLRRTRAGGLRRRSGTAGSPRSWTSRRRRSSRTTSMGWESSCRRASGAR